MSIKQTYEHINKFVKSKPNKKDAERVLSIFNRYMKVASKNSDLKEEIMLQRSRSILTKYVLN